MWGWEKLFSLGTYHHKPSVAKQLAGAEWDQILGHLSMGSMGSTGPIPMPKPWSNKHSPTNKLWVVVLCICGQWFLMHFMVQILHGTQSQHRVLLAWVCSTLWHLLGGESHATIPVFIVTLFLISNFVFFFILCVRFFSFLWSLHVSLFWVFFDLHLFSLSALPHSTLTTVVFDTN